MAEVGRATLNIVPRVVGGLADAINKEVKKANVASIGDGAGKQLSDGLNKGLSGASFAVWSKVASTAIDAVSSSLGSATSRVDTLNNYPRIMESLGVETKDAERSIKTMSDELSNVPTRLDDMATTVEGIYAATTKYGTSIDTVTDAGLALNSMLLAGGQSQAVVNAAMEQFRQMAAKGKPDLQDWRSLLSAAPGQMNQLAKEMLGAKATTEDLYAVLGGGKEDEYFGAFEWGSVSMGEFVERFAGFKERFKHDAEEAQGGIQTAFANMQNAVTRGLAGVMDSFGQENIAGAIGDVKGAINKLFGKDDTEGIRSLAAELAPTLTDLWDQMVAGASTLADEVGPNVQHLVDSVADALNDALPAIGEVAGAAADGVASLVKVAEPLVSATLPAIAGLMEAISGPMSAITPMAVTFAGLNAAVNGISGVIGNVAGGLEAISKVADTAGLTSLSDVFFGAATEADTLAKGLTGPVGLAVVGFTGLVGAYIAKQVEAAQKTDEFFASVRRISDVAESANGALQPGIRFVGEYGEAYKRAGADIDGLMQSMEDYLGKVDSISGDAESQISMLGQYKQVINEMAGEGEVSAEKMAKLEWALNGIKDATGEAHTASEILKDSYRDEAGEIQGVAREINNLIDARQKELRQKALEDIYTETYKMQATAALELSRAEGDYYSKHDQWVANYIATNDGMTSASERAAHAEEAWVDAHQKEISELGEAQNAYDTVSQELVQLEGMMGRAAEATAGAGNKMAEWIDSSQRTSAAVRDTGMDVETLTQMFESAGVGINDLKTIGENDFATLASVCEGNMDAMVAAIVAYNSAPIEVKEGKVTVDDALLRDAQGNVYTWNRDGKPVDQSGRVAVDDLELTDAYGNVVQWNGTELTAKSTSVSTDKGGLDELIQLVRDFMGLPDYLQKSATYTTTNETINIQRNIVEHSGSTYSGGGGHYAMATGGHIEPRHAGGFIAAGPTHTSRGLVGEDGIEAVWQGDDGSMDVYPLNNPRYLGYAKPLAESIAGTLAPLMANTGGDTYIINGLSVPAESELAAYMRKTFRAAIREGRS